MDNLLFLSCFLLLETILSSSNENVYSAVKYRGSDVEAWKEKCKVENEPLGIPIEDCDPYTGPSACVYNVTYYKMVTCRTDLYDIYSLIPNDTVVLDIHGCDMRNNLTQPILEHVTSLKELIIVNVNLRSFSKDFLKGLTNLETLILKQNWITVLTPLSFLYAPNVKHVDLQLNPVPNIAAISTALGLLRNLNTLHLEQNRVLTEIRSDAFSALENTTSFTELHLQDCKIEKIWDDAFKPLKNLTYLDIGSNPFDRQALYNLTYGLQHSNLTVLKLDYLPNINGFPTEELRLLSSTPIMELSFK